MERPKTKKYTHEEYEQKIKEVHGVNVKVIDKYVNMNTKIKHICLIHNVEFYSKPSKVLLGQTGCKECSKQKILLKRTKPKEQFEEDLFKVKGNEYELVDGYVNSSTYANFKHNMKDGTSHNFKSTPNALLSGNNCPCCAGLQVSIGYNNLNTRCKELSNLLANYDDGFKYTEWSGEKVDWKCPNCGFVVNKTIRDVHRDHSVACPICSDGISYPNKYIFNCLCQINNQLDFLDREYSPEWCRFSFRNEVDNKIGKYDIYLGINNKKYIIEMDGGLGHGKKVRGNITQEESKYIDEQKDRLAKEHGIEVIRIDCDYGKVENRFCHITKNIKDSRLADILPIEKIDFNKADINSKNSLLVEACKLWENGCTVKEISEKIKVHETTVSSYLKSGHKCGLCDSYSKKESNYRSCCNSVYCITTNKTFKSITDGANHYNLDPGDISKCCRRKSTFGGWYNGEKLIWVYLEDYNKMSKQEIDSYIPKSNENFTTVVCVETRQEFFAMKDAAEWAGLKNTSSMIVSCKERYKTAGKHPETNVPLHWLYKNDFDNASEEEIDYIINFKSRGKKKKVICLNNNKVFYDANEAKEYYKLPSKLIIQRCCRGEIEFCENSLNTKEHLRWMYYEDYLKLNNDKTSEELVS